MPTGGKQGNARRIVTGVSIVNTRTAPCSRRMHPRRQRPRGPMNEVGLQSQRRSGAGTAVPGLSRRTDGEFLAIS